MSSTAARIHPTALIAPSASIGTGVRIGPYSVIEERAVVGDGTRIEAFVRVWGDVSIGRNCHIFEYSVLGGLPQDHDFDENMRSFVEIGDDVILRENVTVHRATGEGNVTRIGAGSMVMEGCHLAHNVQIGRHCTVTNKVGFSGYVEIGDYAVVGGMTGFHQFVKVGAYAMIGGMAKIIKDVPPYALADGVPARIYGLNTVGLRRRGFTQDERTHIKQIYRTLYNRHMKREEAICEVERSYPNDPFAAEILSFLASPGRGLTPWAHKDVRTRGGEVHE